MVNRLKKSYKASDKTDRRTDNLTSNKKRGSFTSKHSRKLGSGMSESCKPESSNPQEEVTEQHYNVRMVTIDQDDAGQRIDNYLLRILKGVPKTRIYRILRKGEVRVNKKRVTADYRIQEDDLLRIPPIRLAERGEKVKPANSVIERLERSVIFENDKLIILDKPSGIAVHGGSGLNYGVIEALRQIRPDNKTLELVHRLDRDTSGCLVIAKRRSMLRHIHNQLQQKHKVQKIYNALVVGKWPARKLLVNASLQKDVRQSGERMVRVDIDGKKSRTEYRVLERYQGATLVEAKPVTGRTHQIRVHCLHAGHAILGDDKYGADEDNQSFKEQGLKRLFLHAASIEFELPDGEMLKVEAPLPAELQKVLDGLTNMESR